MKETFYTYNKPGGEQERLDELRIVRIRRLVELKQAKKQLAKALEQYHKDDFPGRIKTNEIIVKENSLKAIEMELGNIAREIYKEDESACTRCGKASDSLMTQWVSKGEVRVKDGTERVCPACLGETAGSILSRINEERKGVQI